MTVKILMNPLKEAQAGIAKLKEENRQMKEKIAEHLDPCEESLENRKRMVKIYLPLHKQMKNICKQNRTLNTKDRLRKEQMEKRNLNLLAQVTVE